MRGTADRRTRWGMEANIGKILRQSSRSVSDGCSAQHHIMPWHLTAPEPQKPLQKGQAQLFSPNQGILAAGSPLVQHCSSLSSPPERGSESQSSCNPHLQEEAEPGGFAGKSPEQLSAHCCWGCASGGCPGIKAVMGLIHLGMSPC